jgi:hypothetical protein
MHRNAEALIEQAGADVRSFDRVSVGGRPWIDATSRRRPGARIPPIHLAG